MKLFAGGMIVLAGGMVAQAQQAVNPVVASAQEIFARQSGFMIAAAAEMPEEKYGYSPTPAQWSYGKVIAHVVQGNNLVCTMLTSGGTAPKTTVTEKSSKAELESALKASFDYCSKTLDGVQDAQLGETITFFGGAKKPRARALVELAADLEDHYSQMAGYLRLNGLVPPSAKR